MFDITNYVKLDTEDRKTYTFIRIVIGIFFIAACICFAKELIYPSQTFYFRAEIDSLANTITHPYVTEYGTGFDMATYGEFDKAILTITLDNSEKELQKNTEVAARKSYRAFFSPINNEKYTKHQNETYEINDEYYLAKDSSIYKFVSENAFNSHLFKNHTKLTEADNIIPKDLKIPIVGFAAGALISSESGIFVTEGDTKHPFQDEFAFKSLGYNFDNVIKANSEELGMHKNAKMIDASSTHPFGTIFFAQDAKRAYIYDDDQLHKIENSLQAKHFAITVDEISRETFEKCVLKKAFFFKKTYKCTFDIKNIKEFPGNTYQFIIKDAPSVNIKKSKITFKTSETPESLSHRIETVKKELAKYYDK